MLIGLLPCALASPAAEQVKQADSGGAAVQVAPGLTEPTPLTGTGIPVTEDAGGTFLAFAANTEIEDTPLSSWAMEERGSYALTVFRAGDLSGETTVQLCSVDVTARYGEDYVVDDRSYETLTAETQGTLIEQSVPLTEEAYREEMAPILEAAAGADETGEGAEAPGISRENGKPVSELARLKEAQTGLPSRQTYDTVLLPMEQDLISYVIPDLGSAVETSSSTLLTFRPGEAEKTVVFRVLEDETSEGSEEFSFTLTAPEGAAVFMPYIMNCVIRDDEPLEHSTVTFSQASYVAESDHVTVTVQRSGADYSLVTAQLLSVDEGSAAEGENYAKVDLPIAFDPNVMEASLDIPVKGAPGRETSFSLRLRDLKGGEEGAHMRAVVTIPAAQAEKAEAAALPAEDRGYLSLLSEGSIDIPNFGNGRFSLEKGDNDTYNIMDISKKPAQQVGVYILPTSGHGTWCNYGDSPGTWDNKWTGSYRHMRWYSRLAWDKGGTAYDLKLDKLQNYQQVFLDFSTNTKFESNRHGYKFDLKSPKGTVLASKRFDAGGTVGRGVRGGQVLYVDFLDKAGSTRVGYSAGKLVPSAWPADPENNRLSIRTYAERTEFGCIEPEMNLYGVLALFREYRVVLEQPDELTYLDVAADGQVTAVNRKPANAFLGQGHNVRYPYQQISVTDTSLNPGEPIAGTLKGYYIKPTGTNGKGCWYATSGSVIDLNDDLMRRLDEYARENWTATDSIMIKGGGSYYMELTVKPVYEKNYITVKSVPSRDGKFLWDCLDPDNGDEIRRVAELDGRSFGTGDPADGLTCVSAGNLSTLRTDPENGAIDGLFAVGDRINLDAVPAREGYEYTACLYKGYKNPGDTVPERQMSLDQNAQIANWKRLTLEYSRTELQPQFTNRGNCIEIVFEDGADQYFYLSPIATDAEKAGSFPDKRVLRIDDSCAGDKVTPVLGRAYTLAAVESNGNDGTIRPVFRLADGTAVRGWAVDLIARARPEENVITVGWERYDPASLVYFSLEGVARFESVTIRQSSQALKNEPARDVTVTAAGVPVDSYTRAGRLGQTTLRPTAITDQDGRFTMNGVLAMPGDRISVLLDDNGVAQAEYRVLPREGPAEQRSFWTQQANHAARSNDIVSRTERCVVADVCADPDRDDLGANAFRLPIITGYTPCVTDVRFSLDAHTADTRNNSVPIYAGDYVTLEADVSIPRLGDADAEMKAVQFVIINKDGGVKDVYATTRRTSGDGQPLNTWYISVPYTPTSEWDHPELEDGDKVYVQVLGPERTLSVTHTANDGTVTEETQVLDTPYSLLNSGLTFYTPVEDVAKQSLDLVEENVVSDDFLGQLSTHVNTGTFNWETTYDDPSNKATSSYTDYYGFNISGGNSGLRAKSRLKKAMDLGEKERVASIDDRWAAVAADNQNPFGQAMAQERARINGDPDIEDKAGAIAEVEQGMKQKYINDTHKKSLAECGETATSLTFGLNVHVAFRWVYDKESNTHVKWGFAWEITFSGNISKTTYGFIGVVPVYFNFDVLVSVDYTSSSAEDGQLVYAKDFARKSDLGDYFPSDYSWLTFSFSGALSAGVGLYGVVSARGLLRVGFAYTFATTDGWEPSDGLSFSVGGGFQVDLLITTLGLEHMAGPWKSGYYATKPVKTSGQGKSGRALMAEQAADAPQSSAFSLRAPDPGDESFNAIEQNFSSILVPKQEETIIDGAMSYVRPRAVALDNNTFLILFLENKAGVPDDSGTPRTQANASTLVYAVARADAQNRLRWDTEVKTAILDNDGCADSTFDVLRAGGSVYVAWSTSDLDGDGNDSSVDTLQGAREALSGTSIRLQRLAISGNSVSPAGEPVTVAEDVFQNTNPRLVREGDDIAVYYFKQDLSQVRTIEDLVNYTGNYSTYARKAYSALLTPQLQSGNGGALAANQEMLIRLQRDALADDFTVVSYDAPDGTHYRLSAFTLNRDETARTGDKIQLWLQVYNLTDDRSYSPVLLQEGALANVQLNNVKIKNRVRNGDAWEDVVTDDVFLTWASEGALFHTLSFNSLLAGLGAESGSLSVIRSLTPVEAASANWPSLALSRVSADREDCETLYSLAHSEPVWSTRDFGAQLDGEDRSGSMFDYLLITGDDGNTYLAWTRTSQWVENMGSEVWMSSYYRYNAALIEQLHALQLQWDEYDRAYAEYWRQVEAGSDTAVPPQEPADPRPAASMPCEGWSEPVQITDFRLTMSAEDRARFDELTGRERTGRENEELNALREKYSRAIDELAVVVSHDSGALMLANTFVRGADQTAGYTEAEHKLSAIRCVADTSLELETLSADVADPGPGEEVSLRWDVVNNGLLPGTDYRITASCAADGGQEREIFSMDVDAPSMAVYPGGRQSMNHTWQVPDYRDSLTVTLSVTEMNPATGRVDYETTNTATLAFTRGTRVTAEFPYSRCAGDMAEARTGLELAAAGVAPDAEMFRDPETAALVQYYYDRFRALAEQYGSPEALKEKAALLVPYDSPEDLLNACDALSALAGDETGAEALLRTYGAQDQLVACGGLSGLLEAYDSVKPLLRVCGAGLDPDSNESHCYFYAFVPIANDGSLPLEGLRLTVTGEDGRVLGETVPDTLEAGMKEPVLTPVVLALRKSEIGQMGIADTTVTLTDGSGQVLEQASVLCQLLDNVDVQIVGDSRLKTLDMSSRQQLYQANGGAAGGAAWEAMADPTDQAKRVDLKVGDTIQLSASAFPYDSLKDAAFCSDMTSLKTDGSDVISVTTDGKITALRPGTALVRVCDWSVSGAEVADQVLVSVTASASGGGGGGGAAPGANPVNLPAGSLPLHGKAAASAAAARAGDKVTVTVTPDEGYQVAELAVKDAGGSPVPVTKNADGTYSFIMPDTAVSVLPVFTKIGGSAGSGSCPRDASCPISRFTDANPAAWYHDGVHWALEEGVMKGTSATAFEPSGSATRAMVVTMLWRLDGEPSGASGSPFKDVKDGAWYAEAVAWAAETGAVNGTGADTFSPNAPVTREQLAAILYRYARSKGEGFTGAWAFPLDFSDAAKVSRWADEAMHWMTRNGIITGMGDGTLAPRDNATRAQIATMFLRFAGTMAK